MSAVRDLFGAPCCTHGTPLGRRCLECAAELARRQLAARAANDVPRACAACGCTPPASAKVLPFAVEGSPLSQNAVYRIIRLGRRAAMMMTKEGKAWKAAVLSASQHEAHGSGVKWAEAGPLVVRIRSHYDSRRPDVDGPIKGALDAIADGLEINDRQIVRVIAEKKLDKKRPRLEAAVWADPSYTEEG